ncbi:MAG: NAD-dependent dehydratase [Candidatus Nephthysia bennettiae]|uniref:SDR family oxidoreductase n=1 Tax=Candidatus Nephthysia bennettiae TaxID=3127016 RepID=A0A934N2S2_9BACT|nr:SDR family oxidoreductase [Candidatus Dormibacteraeota bacterium]MBJ7613853.1 SDR family oxidoreductase [Candidatus Dormibacteraeota bacterium]PZR95613.1 MAG: NAD-dependent dehydratase [Candidatus Dormibacteraeota bacterium]
MAVSSARAVVSGAAGFVGSHLCDRLLDRGHRVVGIDNFVTGAAENLAHLEGHPCFELIRQDISAPVRVEGPVDYVLHFASPASPVDFPAIPIEILEVGTLGTRNMLELALAKGARFLLASTSEVYGDPLVHPQPESYLGNVSPTGPRGCYDEAKRCAEAFTMAYHRARGVETRIMRIFNTYGPRMRLDDGRVIPNYFCQALRGEPLTVYGDGSQTRSLCYVDDLVAGALAVLEGPDPMPFNVGSQDEVTMLQLARVVKEVTGSSSEIEFRPLPQDDPRQRRPDTTRASEVLRWAPAISLEDGLARTLEYFRSAL